MKNKLFCLKIIAFILTLGVIVCICNILYTIYAISLLLEIMGLSVMHIVLPFIFVIGLYWFPFAYKSIFFLKNNKNIYSLSYYIVIMIMLLDMLYNHNIEQPIISDSSYVNSYQ